MKNNLKMLSRCVASGILLTIACASAGWPAQAQIGAQSGSRGVTFTPEALEAMAEASQLDHDAAVALHAGRYAEAEATVRQSIALRPFNSGVPDEILAQALDAQGKEHEALDTYKMMADKGDASPRNLLPYALLLLKAGQWAQAVAVFNQALPQLGKGELEQASSNFSVATPEPTALAVAIHIERGQLFNSASGWAGESQSTEALAEYAKALQLAPKYDLSNYYYGIGWQKLSPAEKAKFGTAKRARTALEKAVKVGKGRVKKAAQKALLMAMRTKG